MINKPVFVPVLLLLSSISVRPQAPSPNPTLTFMGRKVTVTEPELEYDRFPQSPATVCLEGPPQQQCFSPLKADAGLNFGLNPSVDIIQLDKDHAALFFEASTEGGSGWAVRFALLRPGNGKYLEEFLESITVSNQNQHAFWSDRTISNSKILIVAEAVWGLDEGHYGKHRYMISAYVARRSSDFDDVQYMLDDRYMTIRKYDGEANPNFLTLEKPAILRRLRAVAKSRTPTPR